ncbi:tripartite motif-containing protein 35-like [Astyanax mexicanus]|uniref:Tripartite motif-containing protein 35-like n=1 Tax=Astyanax mexicanus TaxID=7994 RepID=A0A8T2L1D1_ASTMX|nr:tripartite motif-containing protein 35-like [Astyanax mexicanus]
MASSQNSLEKNLKCSICSDIFKDPVLLSCSHSFCAACLDKSGNVKPTIECSICKLKTKRTFKNLALGQACESFIEEKKRKISESQGAICLDHAEKHQLFCMDDKRLVCMQCVSQNHQSHSFSAIGNMASKYKTELQKTLLELHNKLQNLDQKKVDFLHSSTERLKSEVQQTEEQIKEEFEKLHQFLRDEEEARITALKQEEEEKIKKINEKVMEIEKVWSGLSERIKKTEDDMKGDESLTKFTEPDLELDLGALIDVVKHVGNLKFRVWEKIKDICPYYPVLLVPGSRTSNLQLCKDLISVRANPNTTSQLVSNSLPPAILGSEGFTSGTHSWTVEVGTSDHWAVGITSISGNRLKNPGSKIGLFNGKSTWDSTAPKFTKVRVKLDCENRLVEYTNPDNNTVLQRKNYVIAATMYPYFYTLSQDPLKILPAEVSVTVPTD